MRPTHVLCAMALVGCAPAAWCPAETVPARVIREAAPAPFKDEEIWRAARVGRQDRYLEVHRSLPPVFREVVIEQARENAYLLRSEEHDVVIGWKVGGEATIRVPPPRPTSAVEWMGHARYFDRATTSITEMPCDTALGRLDCIIYSFEDREHGVAIRSTYARSLPGPPVLHSLRLCHRLVHLVALVAHADAPAPPPADMAGRIR